MSCCRHSSVFCVLWRIIHTDAMRCVSFCAPQRKRFLLHNVITSASVRPTDGRTSRLHTAGRANFWHFNLTLVLLQWYFLKGALQLRGVNYPAFQVLCHLEIKFRRLYPWFRGLSFSTAPCQPSPVIPSPQNSRWRQKSTTNYTESIISSTCEHSERYVQN